MKPGVLKSKNVHEFLMNSVCFTKFAKTKFFFLQEVGFETHQHLAKVLSVCEIE